MSVLVEVAATGTHGDGYALYARAQGFLGRKGFGVATTCAMLYRLGSCVERNNPVEAIDIVGGGTRAALCR
jgi:hypothetical protein